MKNIRGKIILMCLFLFLIAETATAQTGNSDFIDLMRSGGKIYVVYLLLGVIVTGVLIHLVILERKLARLEKEIKEKN
jgi:cellulose synthase/poly-beta-1,6-N-acetylglucosamine synthase-like glycosyltransferase